MLKFLRVNLLFFLQLIHLIAMASNLSPSSIKCNSNIVNNLNNELIIPSFGFRIFSVCFVMVRKGKYWIVYFIVVGQYKSLLWRSVILFSEVSDRLSSIFLSYTEASRLSFHSWSNSGWFIFLNRGTTYSLKIFIVIYFLSLNSLRI